MIACHSFVDRNDSIVLTGNQIRQDLRNWLSPPDPSINFNTASDAHHEGTALWFIQGNTFADWKVSGSLLWIFGKRTSFYSSTSPASFLLTDFHLHSRFRQECSQARLFRPGLIMAFIADNPTVLQLSRISSLSAMQDPLI